MNIIQMSLSASCIIAVSIIIRVAALDKLPKRLFQLLWLVAILRLLIPFSLPSKLSIYNLLNNTPATTQMQASHIGTQKLYNPATFNDDFQPLRDMAHEVSPFLFIWCVGIAFIAIYLIIINAKSRRRFAASLPVHNIYIDQYLETNRIRRKIQVRISDQITTPLAYGVIRPVILFPSSFDFNEQAKLHYILTHEFLHIRRFDLIKKLILQTTICVHWFNPLVWVMYILANRDIELACDEGVLGKIGKNAHAGYAMALITMQENKKGAACVNYFSRYAIKERITSIMKYKKASRIAIVTTLLLIIGVTTVFASTGKTEAENGNSKKNNEIDSAHSEIMTSDDIILNKIDEKTGKTLVSDDNGKTWLNEEEWNAQNPTPDIEWWTAEEYSKWLNQERKNLEDSIGDKGWNPTDGWYTLTREVVDETISMYEEILQEIKNGVKHSKSVDGDENLYVSYDPKNIESKTDVSAIITDGNGDEKKFDGYENKADLERDVKNYLKEQVANENMTQDDANKILSDLNYK